MNKRNQATRGYERILYLIEWAATKTEPITLADAIRNFGWPKSSTHLLLQSLVSFRYMEQLTNQSYKLIRLPGEHSNTQSSWGTLLRIAQPYLEEAVNTTQETGCIAVLTKELKLRYLNKILPNREIQYDRDISIDRTPHQVASGLVMLSGFNDEKLSLYIKTFNLDSDTVSRLNQELTQIKNNKYALNILGTVEGAAGVAAPIVDRNGQIIAAVNISGLKERVVKNQATIIEATQLAATRISQHF
ncbi:Acetate operon repressor [Oligella ureolytica]|uniref:IclR family transcriptional regulator n=1 Tax=Oligella ureolytica TaxID=90244 RepID=UPI000DFAF098|nr:IclR family transcriptional regulator C-terminal domain-containing protein [Oligella ureolytica]SUA59106.1 Acetate operon repressor [Oligella ureolytica]